MEDLPINITDLVVIVILALSALFAFVRGFVREVLSVLAWVGAAVVTLYVFKDAQAIAQQYIEVPYIADAVAGGAVFVVVLLVLSMIAHMLAARVRDSAIGPVDRSLGLLFGLARGALIVCIAWLLVTWIVFPGEKPPYITEAKSLPMVQRGADWLASLVPESMRPGTAEGRTLERTGIPGFSVPLSDSETVESSAGAAGTAGGDAETGYDEGQRDDLNRLMDAVNSNPTEGETITPAPQPETEGSGTQ